MTTQQREAIAGCFLTAVVLVAIGLGTFFMLQGSRDLLLYGDELHSLGLLKRASGRFLQTYGANGSGSALLLLQSAAINILGPGSWAFRIPAFLGAMGAMLVMYPIGRRVVGRVPAAISTLALCVSSIHIFYSRCGRMYALTLFLGLVLVYALIRAMEQERPKKIWYAIAALSAGLLPYAHLSAAPFAIGTVLASFAIVWRRGQIRGHGLWVAGILLSATLLCVALYQPALDPLQAFIERKAGRSEPSRILSFDLVVLLAGSRVAAGIWLACIPLAAIWIGARKRTDAFLPVVAAFTMPAALLVFRPVGDVYAYARYVFVGLPFLLMLLAWCAVACVRAVRKGQQDSVISELAVGVLLVAASYALGPHGYRHVDDGPFAASYLTLAPLSPFDEPWTRGSSFYEKLANEQKTSRIVEVPALRDHAIALYRNYYLHHRNSVVVATRNRRIPGGRDGVHVQFKKIDATTADYIVLHVDVAKELARYWHYVFRDQYRDEEPPGIAAFMDYHKPFYIDPPPPLYSVIPSLKERFGEPVHRDPYVVVWKLSP